MKIIIDHSQGILSFIGSTGLSMRLSGTELQLALAENLSSPLIKFVRDSATRSLSPGSDNQPLGATGERWNITASKIKIAPDSGVAALTLTSSGSVTPTEGQIWYDGTTLRFRDATTTRNLVTLPAGSSNAVQFNSSGAFGSSTDFNWASGVLKLTNVTGGNTVFATQATTDVNNRFAVTANGALKFGDGTAVSDITLSRTAANQLTTTSDFLVSRTNGALIFDSASSYSTGPSIQLANTNLKLLLSSKNGLFVSYASNADTSGLREYNGLLVARTLTLNNSDGVVRVRGALISVSANPAGYNNTCTYGVVGVEAYASHDATNTGTISNIYGSLSTASVSDSDGTGNQPVIQKLIGSLATSENQTSAVIVEQIGLKISLVTNGIDINQKRIGLQISAMADDATGLSGARTAAIDIIGTSRARRDGICFATDSWIYSNGANSLKTDGAFTVAGNTVLSGTLQVSGLITASSGITATGFGSTAVVFVGTAGALTHNASQFSYDNASNTLSINGSGATTGLLLGNTGRLYHISAGNLAVSNGLLVQNNLTVGSAYNGTYALSASKTYNTDSTATLFNTTLNYTSATLTGTSTAGEFIITVDTGAGAVGNIFGHTSRAAILNGRAGAAAILCGADNYAYYDGQGGVTALLAGSKSRAYVNTNATGTVVESTALVVESVNATTSAANITAEYGVKVDGQLHGGTITNRYGIFVDYPSTRTHGSGSITNHYGLYIAPFQKGTNKYAIYLNGTGTSMGIHWQSDIELYKGATNLLVNNASHVIAGKLGIGSGMSTSAVPGDALVINQGTSTASYLRFYAGSTTGTTSTDGTVIGVDSAGNLLIRNYENTNVSLYANNLELVKITGAGPVHLPPWAASGLNNGAELRFQFVGSDANNYISLKAPNHTLADTAVQLYLPPTVPIAGQQLGVALVGGSGPYQGYLDWVNSGISRWNDIVDAETDMAVNQSYRVQLGAGEVHFNMPVDPTAGAQVMAIGSVDMVPWKIVVPADVIINIDDISFTGPGYINANEFWTILHLLAVDSATWVMLNLRGSITFDGV